MRRVVIVAGLGVVALVVAWWLRRDDSSSKKAATATRAATKGPRATLVQERPDPQTLKRGSIEGIVTDEETAPIANARVCADGSSNDLDPALLRDLPCVHADAGGRYKLENLLPATYTIEASARTYRPDAHHPGGDPRKAELRLAAGQRLMGVDIVLRGGGVEITGVVSDLTGGPIEKSRVAALGNRFRALQAGARTETAADGTFSLWVAPGAAIVVASAEGYADEQRQTFAPGTVEILLTPESSLSGTVVDAASGAPVANARVAVGAAESGAEESTFSDAQGAFRIARLTPGRYTATARTDHGYGKSEGSTLVGLAQSVDGMVIALHPAVRVEGRVLVSPAKQPCELARVTLADRAKGRWIATHREADGRVWADGVLPGTYRAAVFCEGFRTRVLGEP